MKRFALLFLVGVAACSRSDSQSAAPPPSQTPAAPAATAAPVAPAAPAGTPDEPLPPLKYESELPPAIQAALHERFTGDLDAMVRRRLIRAGVAYNRTNYFVDKGVQRGITYEHLKHFEDRLNAALKTGNLRVHVVFVPMSRDRMLTALVDGEIDLAEGQLTITPERLALVDFGPPYGRNVNEIVVTPPGTTPLESADELSGRDVLVWKSSSYYQSLLALNQRLQAQKRPRAILKEAPENLEDDDLLEMVNAGLVRYVVVDDYLAQFWKQVFAGLTLNTHAVVRRGGELAGAFRKNSPVMARATAQYLERWGPGTAYGNVIRDRYLHNTKFVKSATADAERRKFQALVSMFRTYGQQYDLDYLLMTAQGYQESRLDQNAKSRVGAVGVMQLMPETGAALHVGDIHQTEANVHAGVKYIRQIITTYFNDAPMTPTNKTLFAFASYNAGPNRVRQLRQEAERRGLDPNVWFGNVERVVSAHIGRETVDYVGNIFKYYVAYRLVAEEQERRDVARSGLKSGEPK